MLGKFFQEFFMFLMNGERGYRLELFIRECFGSNGSAQKGSKTSCKREAYPYLRRTVAYRNVPKSHVNAALVKVLGQIVKPPPNSNVNNIL